MSFSQKPSFGIDFNALANKINKRAYKLSDVKDQITRLAFDIVRFNSPDKGAELWQIQSSDDGDYIVALYDVEKQESGWEVKASQGDLNFYYKKDPIVSIACDKIAIPKSEIKQAESYLPAKLANNKKLVKALLNELNFNSRAEVFAKYPELK